MKSIDFITIKKSLNWDTDNYRKILVPLNQLLNWQWNYSVNDVIALAQSFQKHSLLVNIQNLAILSYRYNLNISPIQNNPDYAVFNFHWDNTSLDDYYTQLD